jgi:hypothetical protein
LHKPGRAVKIIYTHHAQQRMAQRQIDPVQVIETLEAPDNVIPGDQHEQIAIKNYGNREVRVVFETSDDETVVIYTVMKPRLRSGE